jgi:predicted DCC family thiol-disulfide oxidoreductase YuxK
LPIYEQTKPILLFDGECGVCRHIAGWVWSLAQSRSRTPTFLERPIGNDPEELLALNPSLNIWDAYATIHMLMPDGSMKLGGEAVAEVFRNLPETKWFTWVFGISIFGFRPFQLLLNGSYVVLADVRPLFGCESCGTPRFWVRPIRRIIQWIEHIRGGNRRSKPLPHFTSLPPTDIRTKPALIGSEPKARQL